MLKLGFYLTALWLSFIITFTDRFDNQFLNPLLEGLGLVVKKVSSNRWDKEFRRGNLTQLRDGIQDILTEIDNQLEV